MAPSRKDFLQQLTSFSVLPMLPASVSSRLNDNAKNKNSMVKVGYNLLTWSAEVSDKLFPVVDRLKKIGYDGVECAMATQEDAPYKRFGKHAADLGLDVTCVLTLSPEENIVSASKTKRQKGLDRIKWGVDRANDMHAKVICGPFHSAYKTFTNAPPTQQEYQWSAGILSAAGEYAAQTDVILALEAINRFECYLCNTIVQTVKLINMASHPNVSVHFDTHHANIEEKRFTKAIDKASPVLGHVHISENDRGTPGSGHVPWDEAFAALAKNGYAGWVTIEAFTRNDPQFANSINVWREYNEPWDIAENGFSFINKMRKKHNI